MRMQDVKKILLITLSNIGDVILTTPVIDRLKKRFPQSHLTVLVGPKASELFNGAPGIELMVYDKFIPLRSKLALAAELRKRRYDLVVDLRNTVFPYLIGPRHRTRVFGKVAKGIVHMRDRHLAKLRPLGIAVDQPAYWLWVGPEDEAYVDELLNKCGIASCDRTVAVSPGAASDLKRWRADGFGEVCDRLMEDGCRVIMVGDEGDSRLIDQIGRAMKNSPVMVPGQTSLRQLGALLKRCRLLIANDTAPMHFGVALGVPTLAVFGPTNHKKYGPIGPLHCVVRRDLNCSPCEESSCSRNRECMNLISSDEVYQVAKRMLSKE